MKLLAAFLVLLGLASAGAGLAWVWFTSEVETAGPLNEPTTVLVERGQTLGGVAGELEQRGIITDARLLRLEARRQGDPAIQAGEFAIPAGASMSQILSVLTEGRAVSYRITVPEGLTTAQILRQIEADARLQGPVPAGEEAPEEGVFLPDTYFFMRGASRASILEQMREAQAELLDEAWAQRTDASAVETPAEAVILASIVQEEAGKLEEIPLIAGLFTNRLKRGIRLQSDPTIIYGVSGGEPLYNRRGQRRTLYRSEIDRKTPWNTYQIDGLPPTPISNPGRAAIEAVLDPPDTDYLFFVADATGGHVFSRTLAEHNRAVRDYRRYEAAEIARERADAD